MENTVQTYLNLITSAHDQQPNFIATVSQSVGMSVRLQQLLTQMKGPLFDLSTPPAGDQLDIVGQWAGISRDVNIPADNVGFTWDSTNVNLQWDTGVWVPPGENVNILTLPDDIYLQLILVKIGANNWDGTTEGAYKIYQEAFAPFIVLIQDNCNMTFDLAIVGGIVPALTLALFTDQLFPLRPQGVRIGAIYTSLDTNPAFAWDSNQPNVKGWDTGSWLEQIG